ncbi:hypothetical protein ACFE04_001409 [Oxalis oulophora]
MALAAIRRITKGASSFNLSSTTTTNNNNSFRATSLINPAFLIPSRGIVSKLFVGGLSYYTTEQGLSEAFSRYGQVIEAKIVVDRVSDKPKGFGFVTFASQDEAEQAISEMDGKPLNGRIVYVSYAKPSKSSSGDGKVIARGPPEPREPSPEPMAEKS